jgi:hypothetical protein
MPTDNDSSETSNGKASRPASGQGKWSKLSKVFKVALTVLIFGLVVRSVDLSAAWDHVTNQTLPLVVLAGAVLMFQIGLGGTRWLIILRHLDARPSPWETLKLFYVSIFFNSYVWGGISGDVVRAWLSYRSSISGKTAVTSVVLDRVAALAGVASLVLLTAPFFLYRVGASMPLLVLFARPGRLRPSGLSEAGQRVSDPGRCHPQPDRIGSCNLHNGLEPEHERDFSGVSCPHATRGTGSQSADLRRRMGCP